ncbi:hypothetical protein [Streptomyces sp. sk2.1]|jgi:hypothetical protein|uniref:hypothetical protein n=1 Tax=Streptomyces sp. sk2.1 TaxID=2478959 RepID=UPI001652BD78|nr:hypothetical protein [Streptomyces sp. sk2.1]
MLFRKTDRECAALAVAAAIVAPKPADTRSLIKQTLNPDELQRAKDYLASGKPIGGRG